MNSKTTVVIGAQWGDEGKGKLVDILGETHSHIVRSGGGANAGHTIVRDGEKYVFHLLPSGLLTEGNVGVVGNGCVVHIHELFAEIEKLESQGLSLENKIYISDRAHILFDYHRAIDAWQEEERGLNGIGTTKRGIGPCYADKISRQGIRAIDCLNTERLRLKLEETAKRIKNRYNIDLDTEAEIASISQYGERLKTMIINASEYLEIMRNKGENLLIEGAQAFQLDIDFGTYPFVTSSSINTGGMATGCGLSPRSFTEVIGVAKAYCTRVGAGPFPSELSGETEEELRKLGGEFGATTGRPRRCGWLDLVSLYDFTRVNAPDSWNLTKLDVLDSFEKIGVVTAYMLDGEKITASPAAIEDVERIEPVIEYLDGWQSDISECRSFDELPENAKKYIAYIEEKTGVPARYIGVGAGNQALITKD